MSGLFEMSTRRRIELFNRESLIRRQLGYPSYPTVVIPRSTRVAVLDLFTSGAYVQLPDGSRFVVNGDALTKPRRKAETS